MKTKLSIIVPCYNAGKYLAKTLDSVINQTCHEWECVIVDDGSTDNSIEIYSRYAEQDSRFVTILQENSGAGAARNNGIKIAQGEFILLLDADDWISENCVENVLDFFKENPNATMYNLRSMWIDEQSKTTIPGHHYIDYRHVLIYGQNNMMVFKKADFEEKGGFDVAMKRGFEDWEFYVRLLSPSSIVKVSDDVLYYYRINVSQHNVSAIGELHKAEVMKYIYKKNIDKYMDVLGAPQLQYQWADRRLPKLVHSIQQIWQYLINKIR